MAAHTSWSSSKWEAKVKVHDREHVDLVASAAVDALMVARWQCADLLSRKAPDLAVDLLRGHAAELASSPIARDQILSKALDVAAADIQAGHPPLEDGALFFFQGDPPSRTERQIVREQVFRHCGISGQFSELAAADLERRCRSATSGGQDQAEELAAEARLHELLWDDPRLPADTHTRLIMLCTVPKVVERAEALEPSRARSFGRRETPFRRRQRSLALTLSRWTPAPPQPPARLRARLPSSGWLLALGMVLAGVTGWVIIDA